jgi:hypothetical protein
MTGFLNTDADANSDAGTLLLYYSGHGYAGTGDWWLHDGVLSFTEVKHQWSGSVVQKNAKLLVLVLDSCFSAWWVAMARDRILRGVVIQAAFGEDRLTLGDGMFNEVFVEYQSYTLTYGTSTGLRPLCRKLMGPRGWCYF